MNSYEFKVSLRINHPTISPDRITTTTGILPFRFWEVGQPRMSPKGTPLSGVSKESFWAAKLHKERKLRSEDIQLEDYLLSACSRLAHLADFFEEIVDTGGYVEFFVGWFGPIMFGATFEPTLMRQAAELNVAIGLDVYTGEKQ